MEMDWMGFYSVFVNMLFPQFDYCLSQKLLFAFLLFFLDLTQLQFPVLSYVIDFLFDDRPLE